MRLSVEQKQVQSQIASQQMQQALFLLSKSAWELNEYVREQALENPVLEAREPEWQERDLFPGAAGYYGESYEKAAPETLAEKLFGQLDLKKLGKEELRAAKEIIDALDSRGYFTESLADIARLCGLNGTQAKHALAAVQSLDPAGVGARSLSECLCLQLERMGEKEDAPYRIARDYLEELARGDYAGIALALGIPAAKSRAYCALLRSLRPGVSNIPQEEAAQYVYPEILVEKEGDALRVILDERKIIRPFVNDAYELCDLDSETKAYLQERRAMAKRIVQSVELWKTMLRRVAEKIILVQQAFFLVGEPLCPLKMADVARELDVHPSTVSRAVAGKYLMCEDGIFPLKSFFSRSISGRGKNVSGDYIRRSIREMLAREPGLSDNAITERLQDRGAKIARRTVAKYRREMGIASSYRRNK
ncbi:RNA polymerase factor sigma-54 [Christensenella tenuis]|uniref:RNA polymerase factor sigma-54 n=1 Tax=Christensenella tenuis TaxID=2763033 RepID=A0ABR7EE32_9FIRM|nr:RNA polymerase factor sigma-54 [Christensenella tenuis]MBC5648045.1 RNA polymerase factor sigma-54 [Christensenella tenuis]